MQIVEAAWGDALTLLLKGRFDANTSNEAQEKLMALISKGYIRLVVDFSELDYISTAGLRVLLTAFKKLKECRGRMVLCALNDHLRQIFEIAGFTALFSIHDSADAARATFRRADRIDQFVTGSRVGPNEEGYFGESIDIDAVQHEIANVAAALGWEKVLFLDEPGRQLAAYRRPGSEPLGSIYLSAGIHGDEPAAPLAILQLLWEHQWPANWSIYLCPCLNPDGFRGNARMNAEGIDLNRDYFRTRSREIAAHIAWLEKQPRFSATISLHEDWEAVGFYAYQLGSLSLDQVMRRIFDAAAPICAVDHSPLIDHLPADHGMLDLAFHSLQANEKLIDAFAEGEARTIPATALESVWSEPVYLINRKTPISYTLETPSAFPLDIRIATLVQVVKAILKEPSDFHSWSPAQIA